MNRGSSESSLAELYINYQSVENDIYITYSLKISILVKKFFGVIFLLENEDLRYYAITGGQVALEYFNISVEVAGVCLYLSASCCCIAA